MNETQRKQAMHECPILSDYLATALLDLQYSESDESCTDEREERDTGTIYDCPDETFNRALADCQAFMRDNAEHIEQAVDYHPANGGLGDKALTHERIGSTWYLSRVGHGVGFTDDGSAPCLEAMESYCRSHGTEGLYFGDNGKVYWI